MTKFSKYISAQFKNPKGIGGKFITFLQNRINAAMYRNVAMLVSVNAEDNLLDVGYGNGYLLKKLYQKSGANLYGIDISNDAKAMATRKNKAANQAGKLHLQVGDCCDLPFAGEMFDAVTTINTVYFWADTVKGLSEIRRVLKPGAVFYNVVYSKEYLDKVKYTQIGFKKFESDELIEAGKQAGFQDITIKEIVKGDSYIIIYKK